MAQIPFHRKKHFNVGLGSTTGLHITIGILQKEALGMEQWCSYLGFHFGYKTGFIAHNELKKYLNKINDIGNFINS